LVKLSGKQPVTSKVSRMIGVKCVKFNFFIILLSLKTSKYLAFKEKKIISECYSKSIKLLSFITDQDSRQWGNNYRY
jgi:hypothetical protein